LPVIPDESGFNTNTNPYLIQSIRKMFELKDNTPTGNLYTDNFKLYSDKFKPSTDLP